MRTTLSIRELFAHNLKVWRQKKKFSQEELADRSGLHRTYISSVERAKRNISIDNIEKLANALEVNICVLLSSDNFNETTPR
ncbi:XRE family transcriptional regulator [Thioploca ingrica]|uniref:XRE family transcriptional regulator n=1 Tax=Thioploca ingrica TaxID=40754 RepID=A0A090ACP8_9GAMM|nr:XRE family transcriptional regulator [Thioploca ingrica]